MTTRIALILLAGPFLHSAVKAADAPTGVAGPLMAPTAAKAPAPKPTPAPAQATPAILSASAKNPKAPTPNAVLPPTGPGWRLSAGPQYRTLGNASFHNNAQAPSFALPNFSGLADSAGSGSSGGYSDGYVLQDITGSATQTWNFGYSSGASGDTLTLHGSSVSISTETLGQLHNSDWDDDAQGWGGFIKLESPELLNWRGISLSAVASYSFMRTDLDHSALAYSATQTTRFGGGAFTDTYTSLGGPLPATHAGNFVGPGLVLSRVPVHSGGGAGGSGEEIVTKVESTIRNELKLDLHTFSFGPQFTFNTTVPKLSLGGSTGLALNIADWTATTDETLSTTDGNVLARWHDRNSGTEVLPGLYVEANAAYALSAKWSITAFGRYDWSEALKGDSGASTFELNLTGWTLGVGATYRF